MILPTFPQRFLWGTATAAHQVEALANKTVRVAWAMLRNGTDFKPELAAV